MTAGNAIGTMLLLRAAQGQRSRLAQSPHARAGAARRLAAAAGLDPGAPAAAAQLRAAGAREGTNGLAIAALVCAIASLGLLVLSVGLSFMLSLPLGLAGWACAARAPKDVRPGQLKTGQVLAIIAVALSVTAAIAWVVLMAAGYSPEDLQRSLEQELSGSDRARSYSQRVTPNPFIKQYLMTAGPDAGAAGASRRRWPSRCSTTARPPSSSSTSACWRKLPGGLPDRQRRADVRRQRLGRDGVGRRQPRPPRHAGARLRRRQVRRALDRARRGLRRRRRPLRAGLGRAPRPGRDRPPAGREPGRSRSSSPR